MSTNIKRRSSERARPSKKPTYVKLMNLGPEGWLDEVFSIACIAVSLFLLVSLLSYQYNTGLYSEMLVDNPDVHFETRKNLMGPVGNFIASMLLNNMGWCAFVSVFWVAWLAWYFWNYDSQDKKFKVSSAVFFLVGLFLILTFSCVLGALIGGASYGGILGTAIASPLKRLFNFWGAVLITVVGLYLSLAVVSKKSVTELLSVSASFVFIAVPLLLVNLLLISYRLISFFLVSIIAFVFRLAGFDNQTAVKEKETSLPKPRRRLNEIKVEEPVEEAAQEPVTETYSHVVVSRKRSSIKLKDAETKSLRKRVEKIKESQDELMLGYEKPDLAFLTKSEENFVSEDDEELIKTSKQIEAKLKDFNILGRVTEVHPGPVITLYEFEPAPGVKVGRISALQDDLAMSLRATSIRIIAPIPKRGTVGIEVPNRNRELVRLRDIVESDAFINSESILSVAIGKDTYGEPVVVDIAAMPHLLMAGTTGTGKSVCINTTLVSMLYKCTPAELGLIMIDPKILELSVYEGIPHLRVPVVTNAKQAKAVLDWAAREMERRYRLMQKYGVRSIDGYNKVVKGETDLKLAEKDQQKTDIKDSTNPLNHDEDIVPQNVPVEKDIKLSAAQQDLLLQEKLEPLPKIVIVIDELADLMLAVGRDIEELITRLAQKARAAGIHLIVATQRPSVDVITGLIKANFPARLSFRVSSRIDSRTILDSMGAEKLLGKGDMLFQAPGSPHLKRVHGAFVSDGEVKKVIEFLKKNSKPFYDEKIMQACEDALQEEKAGEGGYDAMEEGEYDSFYDKAVELVVQKGQASTSMIQRAFRIGYNRAARIIEMMEKEGIIGPMDGVKPRDVLVQNQDATE